MRLQIYGHQAVVITTAWWPFVVRLGKLQRDAIWISASHFVQLQQYDTMLVYLAKQCSIVVDAVCCRMLCTAQ